jgi:hypothetical protein
MVRELTNLRVRGGEEGEASGLWAGKGAAEGIDEARAVGVGQLGVRARCAWLSRNRGARPRSFLAYVRGVQGSFPTCCPAGRDTDIDVVAGPMPLHPMAWSTAGRAPHLTPPRTSCGSGMPANRASRAAALARMALRDGRRHGLSDGRSRLQQSPTMTGRGARGERHVGG